MSFFKSFSNCIKYSDKVLWTIITLISIYGLTLVKSISRETFNYFNVQFLSVVIGILGALFLQTLDYKFLLKKYKWIAAISIILMVYTLVVGVKVEGSMGINAKAWIRLPGGITFQPSELVKIGFTITFAKHLCFLNETNSITKFKSIFFLAIHAFVPVALAHLQGDDGAAIIFLCIALIMAFMGGVPFRYFIIFILIVVMLIPVLWQFVLADYQKKRILIQMNPESDPLNMGYQQIQGKLSIGSGGLFGYGLFKGPRVANSVVPVQESDFIFSAVGEELGFLGCLFLIFLILSAVFRIGYISRKSGEIDGSLICFGIIGIIISQTIFNLGMCLSLLPVMGVTLPFFSVGGSSASCLYLAIGIIQNIFLHKNEVKNII